MMQIYEVRYICLDDTSPVLMEDCVNKNLDDIPRKDLNEINEICVHEEGGLFITENEDVINRDVTKNKPETNWFTLKEVIDECPDYLNGDERKKLMKQKPIGIPRKW